jgi:hypothetical protein
MDKGKRKTRAEDEAMDVDVDGEVNVDVVVVDMVEDVSLCRFVFSSNVGD